MKIRPMLASATPESLSTLHYPVLASPKIDAIRCLILSAEDYEQQTGNECYTDAVPVTRKLKPIPNRYVREMLSQRDLIGLDGELAVGLPTGQDVMQRATSGLMSHDGQPDFHFHVFDNWTRGKTPFNRVYHHLQSLTLPPYISILPQKIILSAELLSEFEEECLTLKYEGAVTRLPDSPYKFNRSTPREQYLVKIKQYKTSEAKIVGFNPWYHNANPLEQDELGYAKRSSHQENKVAAEMLGSFQVEKDNILFSVGGGMTHQQRFLYWKMREELLADGYHVTYKHFANSGVKNKPRQPIFLNLRHPSDMS
jgi:DNA ligase-1